MLGDNSRSSDTSCPAVCTNYESRGEVPCRILKERPVSVSLDEERRARVRGVAFVVVPVKLPAAD